MDRNTLALAFGQIILKDALGRNPIVTRTIIEEAINDGFVAADRFVLNTAVATIEVNPIVYRANGEHAPMAVVPSASYDDNDLVDRNTGLLSDYGDRDEGEEIVSARLYQQEHPNADWYPGVGFREPSDTPEGFVFPRAEPEEPQVDVYDNGDWVFSANGREVLDPRDVNDANRGDVVVQKAAAYHAAHPEGRWKKGLGFQGIEPTPLERADVRDMLSDQSS